MKMRGMTAALVVGVVCVLGAMLGGCSGSARASADYVMVYLKTGPAHPPTEEQREIFKGHMANMHRLADEGKLLIAGPFDRPRDRTWRGIFVLDTPSVETAREWTGTDPGVKSGVFVTEMRALRASPALRRAVELEKQMPKAEAKPGEPPPNIRAYVMVTADDADAARVVIGASRLADTVVWCGRFGDGAGGVFVLDAAKVGDVEGELLGFGLDGWWSTKALMGLPEEARVLVDAAPK
jgi:uncharacterized protein YciI